MPDVPTDPIPSQFQGKLLSPAALQAVRDSLTALRHTLLDEAAKSADREIDEEDIRAAYQHLCFPARDTLQSRDAQSVISQALRENRFIEWVSYAMALILFVFGLLLLSLGVFVNDTAVRIGAFAGGSIVEVLILVPFRFAINSRRHNIALRMLGIILNRVEDPQKVAALLKDTFVAVVLDRPQLKGGAIACAAGSPPGISGCSPRPIALRRS